MTKNKRTRARNWANKSKAFALGLSGAGLLVSCPTQVHALQRGDSIREAWSNVGKNLDRSFAKLKDESEKRRA